MKYLTRALACALVVVGLAASGAIGQDVYMGTITRIDQPARVVIFDDGRMYRVMPNTVLLANNQPVMYTTLQPGAYVVVRSGEPVMYRDGQYVVVSSGAMAPAYPSGVYASPAYTSPAYTSPAYTTTVTTVTTTNPQLLTSASGIVAGYDPRSNIVTLTDGRMVQLSSKSAILVSGHPTVPDQLAPGMPVMISAVNPVVSRDGRSVLLNEGFFDPGNGGSLTWDAKFAGYEGDTANAAMQPQAN
jgi:hypothetical protein